jgi:hypothetical protein
MTTLLIAVGALFLAVICRAALDPRPSHAAREHEDRADADDATPIMDTIAPSLF